jgi:hypothetical protein
LGRTVGQAGAGSTRRRSVPASVGEGHAALIVSSARRRSVCESSHSGGAGLSALQDSVQTKQCVSWEGLLSGQFLNAPGFSEPHSAAMPFPA